MTDDIANGSKLERDLYVILGPLVVMYRCDTIRYFFCVCIRVFGLFLTAHFLLLSIQILTH
jgi:hypothetical protein